MDLKYSIRDLVDIDELRSLFEDFSSATGFTTGFVSYPDQELLITTGWRDICTKFHRACPASAECCKKSNIYLTACLQDLREFSIKKCENGLVDAATPVVIRGVHLASLATGQVLLSQPDPEFFKGLAKKYGYDPEKYLEALARVPVVSEEQLKHALKFLSALAIQIAEKGLGRLQSLKSTNALQEALIESERRYRGIVESFDGLIYLCDKDYRVEFVNQQFIERVGRNPVGEFCYNVMHGRESVCPWCANDRVFAGETVRWEGQSPKDNRWLYIVSNPVRLANGKISKQSMIMDITERKQAEAALKESQEQLRTFIEQAPLCVAMFDRNMNYIAASRRWTIEYGNAHHELKGLNYYEVNPDMPAAWKKAHRDGLQGRASECEEDQWIRSNGTVQWLRWAAHPWRDARYEIGGIIISSENITPRKQAEEALKKAHDTLEHRVRERTSELQAAYADLRKKEASIRTLSDNIPNGITYQLVRTQNGHTYFEFISANIERLYGISHSHVMADGGLILSSLHPDDASGILKAREESIRSLCPLSVEGRIIKPSGEIRWLHWRSMPRRLDNGDMLSDGIAQDITERKKAEESLNRAHRTLQVLKECNEALVRASTESELLGCVCQILMNIWGARLAWVGFAEDDSRKTVRVVAGSNPEFMSKLDITWANEPRGQGPAGAAIRTRKVNICRNLLENERFKFCGGEAIKLGLVSLIALPLISHDHCLGVLMIYSEQMDAFNGEEVSLLKQLADDLGYGITSLRTRSERLKLQQELLAISEREKQLISQELHDGLCQNLAGTALMASTLHRRLASGEHPDAENAKQISDMLSINVNETRNLSHGLHPVGPDGEGLMNALAQLSKTVRNLFHIDCSFRCPSPVILNNEVASTHLFRITQEAINNARKHGEANRILISLRKTSKAIVLTVRDNGIGMPQKLVKTRGLGLRTMKHRANEIHATLIVRRAGKRGTVVSCSLPLGIAVS